MLASVPHETVRLACSQYASKHTVQLFDVHPRVSFSRIRIPRALATGVLLQYREHNIVLTASHVLDSADVQQYGLFIGHHTTSGFIDLGDFSFVRTGSNGNRVTDDDIDLAVIFLEPEIGQRVRDAGGFEFTPVFEGEASEDSLYSCAHFIHGFPLTLTTFSQHNHHFDRRSLSCFLPLYDGTQGSWEVNVGDAHMDLAYNPHEVTTLDGSGHTLQLPEPRGFSGCGVWRVPIDEESVFGSDLTMILAGIVHRFNRPLQALRATRVEVLYTIIQHHLADINHGHTR